MVPTVTTADTTHEVSAEQSKHVSADRIMEMARLKSRNSFRKGEEAGTLKSIDTTPAKNEHLHLRRSHEAQPSRCRDRGNGCRLVIAASSAPAVRVHQVNHEVEARSERRAEPMLEENRKQEGSVLENQAGRGTHGRRLRPMFFFTSRVIHRGLPLWGVAKFPEERAGRAHRQEPRYWKHIRYAAFGGKDVLSKSGHALSAGCRGGWRLGGEMSAHHYPDLHMRTGAGSRGLIAEGMSERQMRRSWGRAHAGFPAGRDKPKLDPLPRSEGVLRKAEKDYAATQDA